MPDIKNIVAALELTKVEHKTLGVTVATHKITPGQHVPKADAQKAPELSFDVASGTYLVICLDLDAPLPSLNFASPVLHWMQSDLKPEKAAGGTSKLSAAGTPFISDYAPPGPPPPSSPHRYVFLLYEQPQDFDFAKYAPAGGAKMGMWPRVKYDLAAFEKLAKLGPIIACNYFFSK